MWHEWSTLKKLMWLYKGVMKAASWVWKTVSGSLLHITDALAGNVSALSVAINPVQDLHGYENPWPAGGGKNVMPYPSARDVTFVGVHIVSDGNGKITMTGTATGNDYATIVLSSPFTIPDGTNYKVCFLNNQIINKNVVGFYNGSTKVDDWSLTALNKESAYAAMSNKECDRIRVYMIAGVEYNVTMQIMFVPNSVSATAYIPYSNICPISGWTEAKVWREITHDTTADPILTIDLDGTIYGGTLDVLTGVLTARPYYASYNGEALVGPWVSSMDKYVAGATPTTGAQVVDLGGTPATTQLTPAQLSTLAGENNVWADTGDTTMTYMAKEA
jgi:hypothetical protein